MSRVFEALTKAGAEKSKSLEQIAQVDGESVSTEIDLAIESRNGALSGLGGVGHGKDMMDPPPTPAKVTGSISWRERIEEWVFGWDLRRYSNYPLVALEKDTPASEQYKILREQIKRLRSESGIQVLSVTSPVKRDGKTTVAVNLAATLALDYEEKVLLIDADLRAPTVHRYYNLNLSPGLADYLGSNSNAGVKGMVQDTFLPSLKVLSAGKPTSFSSELLAKEKMKHVMDEIRSEYPGYQIVVDTPPVLSTPDPMVLAQRVDGILLVIRAGKTPRDYLVKAIQSLNSNKVMGIVLNGAEMGISSKYYYYTTNGAH